MKNEYVTINIYGAELINNKIDIINNGILMK
jgi:hypothetical protein